MSGAGRVRTILGRDDRLPLTCTRSGTCCHGKRIAVNPWELALLARCLGRDPRAVRDTHIGDGGIRLRMDGTHRWRGRPACTFFNEHEGCTAHAGRPLACRLYPLGRERQGEEVRYVHDGATFPCLDGCLEVTDLPFLSVGDYLADQRVGAAEAAQDAYLGMVEELAEGAFVLLLDTPLRQEGREVLARWRTGTLLSGEARARRLGKFWLDQLTLVAADPQDLDGFLATHRAALQHHTQERYGRMDDLPALREGCDICWHLALHLGSSLGAEVEDLARAWLATAETELASGG